MSISMEKSTKQRATAFIIIEFYKCNLQILGAPCDL